MYTIDYDYADAKGRKHHMQLLTDNQDESEIIWETVRQIFNSTMRNGTLTHVAGFRNSPSRRKS